MPKRTATKKEKEHMGKVAELGCIICGAPAEIHHIINGTMGKRASNYDVIPLCPPHHRTGNFGEAVHNGTRTWEAKYGTQNKLLEKTNQRIGILEGL